MRKRIFDIREKLVLVPMSDDQREYIRTRAVQEGRSFRRQAQHMIGLPKREQDFNYNH